MFPRIIVALFVFATSVAIAEGEPTPEALGKQFDAQVARLVERGYPAMFGDRAIFDEKMAQLRVEAVKYVPAKPGYTFLIVVPCNCAPRAWQIRNIVLTTGEACSVVDTHLLRYNTSFNDLYRSAPREPYLICDVDTGEETKNVRIDEAVVRFRDAHRRPLTFDETVALLVQYPETLCAVKIAAAGTVIVETEYAFIGKQCAYWEIDDAPLRKPRVDANAYDKLNDAEDSYHDFCFPSCKE